ncbi:hypothetical protein CFP56_028050 [Quercus suber]|uniref:Uncharacterized protein n=1 Tax=Quercus suber TaxID=58331 RepID=A0AAW0JVG5_QUESU
MLVLPSDNSELFIDCGGGGRIDFLDFLPCIERARKNYPFCIKASLNDLLLVRSEVPPGRRPSFCEYCICNPLTKQWLRLPHLPYSRRNNMVGFICDLCSCDKEQGCVTNAYYRYKVALSSCDPFNDAERCHYIDPSIDLLARDSVSFGVFQGHLRIFQSPCHQYPHNDGAYKFYVWELENYGTWCLKHKVYFKDTVSDHSDLVKIANGITRPGPC